MSYDDWDLGRYVRVRERANGSLRFFMEVPKRFRPADWPPTIDLPQLAEVSRISLAVRYSPAYLDIVRREAAILNRELDERRERRAEIGERVTGRTLADLAEIYKNSSGYHDLSEGRRYRADLWLKRIIRWSALRGYSDFTKLMKPQMEQFLRLYDNKPSARLDARSVWHILCNEAISAGWRTDHPLEKVSWTAPEPARPNLWSMEDAIRYREVAEARGMAVIGAFIEVQMSAGQRPSDLLRCRHGINYRKGWFAIRQSKTRSKTQRVVKFPVPRHLQDLIESIRHPDSDAVFPDPESRGLFIYQRFARQFAELRHAVCEEGDKLLQIIHLRHSAVCQMARSGLSDFEIAGITGHNYETVRHILEKYAIDRPGFAAQGARRLHLANGGSEEDFTELTAAEDMDWLLDEARPRYKRPWSDRPSRATAEDESDVRAA